MHMVATILNAGHCLLVNVDFCDIEGKDLCHIQVKRSTSPVYVHLNDRAHFFMRKGNVTKELEVREALDYIEKRLK